MKKIVIFGNCQASALKYFLSISLPSSAFTIVYYPNNARTGNMAGKEEILDAINKADIVIYQPLGNAWGELSEDNIRKISKQQSNFISFAYIFNSGIYSLCHAPMMMKNKYGTIFGEDVIVDLLTKKNLNEIIQDYLQGSIDFDLHKRFEICLKEMRRREKSTDIKLSDFIENNYREQKLFLSHNHPASALLYEICTQIRVIAGLPIILEGLDLSNENISKLPQPNCPISPYDIRVHGYKFNHDTDWAEKGILLITTIAEHSLMERQIK